MASLESTSPKFSSAFESCHNVHCTFLSFFFFFFFFFWHSIIRTSAYTWVLARHITNSHLRVGERPFRSLLVGLGLSRKMDFYLNNCNIDLGHLDQDPVQRASPEGNRLIWGDQHAREGKTDVCCCPIMASQHLFYNTPYTVMSTRLLRTTHV